MLKLLAQDLLAGAGQTMVEHRCIDLPEVNRVLRISVLKVVQVGIGAMNPGVDAASQQKYRRRRAVVRSAAGVFGQSATELGENKHQHALVLHLQIIDSQLVHIDPSDYPPGLRHINLQTSSISNRHGRVTPHSAERTHRLVCCKY